MNKIVKDCEYLSNLISAQFDENYQITSEDLDTLLFALSKNERELIFKFYQDGYNLTNQELISLLNSFQYLLCHNKIFEILILMKFRDAEYFSQIISLNLCTDFNKIKIYEDLLNTFAANDLVEPLSLNEDFNSSEMLKWTLTAATEGSVKVLNYLYEVWNGLKLHEEAVFDRAIRRNQPEILEILFNHGFKITPVIFDKYLKIITLRKQDQILKLLVEHSDLVNLNVDNKYLIRAREYNSPLLLELLFKKGITFTLEALHMNLFRAINNNSYKIAEILLLNGADIHWEDDLCLKEMLSNWHEFSEDAIQFIKLLLDLGATFTEDNFLAVCNQCKKAKLIEILIEYGANVNYENLSGNTPLTLACWKNCFEIVDILLKNGANVHFNDEQPLYISINSRPSLKMAKLLLENGADPNNDKIVETLDLFWFKETDPKIVDLVQHFIMYGKN